MTKTLDMRIPAHAFLFIIIRDSSRGSISKLNIWLQEADWRIIYFDTYMNCTRTDLLINASIFFEIPRIDAIIHTLSYAMKIIKKFESPNWHLHADISLLRNEFYDKMCEYFQNSVLVNPSIAGAISNIRNYNNYIPFLNIQILSPLLDGIDIYAKFIHWIYIAEYWMIPL